MRLRTVTILLVVAVLAVVIAAVIVGTAHRASSAACRQRGCRPQRRRERCRHRGRTGQPVPGCRYADSRSTQQGQNRQEQPDKNKPDDGGPSSGKEGNPSISTPVPYRLPGSTPPTRHRPQPKALVSAPLPATASARGSIVKGFPAVIPQAPESTITFSSVATEGDRMQMGLDATTSVSADGVLSITAPCSSPSASWRHPPPRWTDRLRCPSSAAAMASRSPCRPRQAVRSALHVTGVFIAGT